MTHRDSTHRDTPYLDAAETRYRHVFAFEGTSPLMVSIWRDAFAEEYPEELEPFGFVTRSDLRCIRDALELERGDLLLDLGCGQGGPGLWVARELGARLVGVDVLESAVERARAFAGRFEGAPEARFEVGSFTGTRLEDAAADGVMSVDAFWMVLDKKAAAQEMARICAAGARLAFTTWAPSYLDLEQLLSTHGFRFLSQEETSGWQERQLAVYRGILRHQAELRRELGEEAAATLVSEAREAPRELSKTPRVLVVAERAGAPRTRRQREMTASEAVAREPAPATGLEVAIVGMAGRFPGARDVDQLWTHLRRGVESITFFSEEELRQAGVDPALAAQPGYVAAKGLLEDADHFDAEHFGYSPREAEILDPQHRLFLECAWDALLDAGHEPMSLEAPVGIYGGASVNSYLLNVLPRRELLASVGEQQIHISNAHDFLCSRVAYKMGLEGPSVVVQAACSTSLVAVHEACQALLSGECDMALAGGVSAFFPQKRGYLYQEGGLLSPDGHCRAFDARGQGFVTGEGVGLVVLKRLADALRDGDRIRAVIRGSAQTNDGALKAGYTAPRLDGQANAIRAAHLLAEVDPDTITYIEAHGTATELGDPLEVRALSKVFRARTERTGFCALGSVKTNIGHLDIAAGVASLIKTVLCLEHRELPPSLHFETPNPEIDFAASPFYVNTELAPWPPGPSPRRAGVNAFGVGGVNVHVVLEEAPAGAGDRQPLPARLWERRRYTFESTAAVSVPAASEGKRERVDWFSVPSWQLLPDLPAELTAAPVRFLVLGDAGGARQALAGSLREAGHAVVSAAEVEAGLAEMAEPPAAVVHLEGSSGTAEETFARLLALVQALVAHEGGEEVDLVLVASGLARIEGGDRLDPARSTLWGPARVIADEHPGMSCRVVDVDLGQADGLRTLLTELTAGSEPVVALRGERRFAPTFVPLRLQEPATDPWREEGVYLLTGAFGGLGRALGEHLAKGWRARLVLVGRTALPERSEWPERRAGDDPVGIRIRHVEALEAAGATVQVAVADVSDQQRMAAVVAEAVERFGRLDGVFHLAGAPGEGLLRTKSREEAERVLAPKVAGTRVLEEVLGEVPIDFLVFFSSLAAWTGGLGQADYCAANAFLGATAQDRKARGLPALAIDWSDWQWDAWSSTSALLAEPRIAEPLRRRRELWGLSFEEGLEALRRALGSGQAQVVVSPRRLEAVLAERQGLAEALGALAGSGEPGERHPRPELATPFVAPRNPTEERLAELWQELLGVDSVGVDDDFFQLGGHSLLAFQLIARVRETYPVSLPPRDFLAAPTIAQLSAVIAGEAGRGSSEPEITRSAQRDPEELLSNLDALSEEELNTLLGEMLTQEQEVP